MNIFVTMTGVFDIMFAHWEISLLALVVFISLLVVIFKGIVKGLKAFLFNLVVASLLIVGVWSAVLAQKDPLSLVSYAIGWAPTVLFVAVIFFSTLLGACRGLRKSAILLLHSLCAGGLCIGLFFFFTSSKQIDEWLLGAVNGIMGGPNALQNALGVTGGATLREVFARFLPSLFSGTEFGMLLQNNDAYVMTVVDLGYRLAFAVICYLIYLLLVFLLYVVYHIFYSERKHKRKKSIAFQNGETEIAYKKRRIFGGIIGFFRGAAMGLLSLSFIGGVFYLAAGGTGEGEAADVRFGDKDADLGYSIYRSIESYGTQGIFKILNAVKDPNDTPYYLFAADLILSGGLDDEKNGIDENIKFREEIGAYVGFARDTLNLLLEYGGDSLRPVLSGESSDDAMGVVLDIMTIPAFRDEFSDLIEHFDSQTYVINFSLALADSVICNIDDISFMSSVSDDNKELLKVLFREGYLSEVIPDERALREELHSSVVTDAKQAPPSFRLNRFFNKGDAQIVLNVVLSSLVTEDSLELTKEILPQIEKLSLFDSGRKEEADPVLGRLYCYLENKYLTEEGGAGITYKEISREKLSWGEELRTLICATENLLALYGNLTKTDDPAQMVLDIFDENNAHYEENLILYDKVCASISDSVLMGKVLSSGYITKFIAESLQGISNNVYVPEDIVYENRYDGAGNLLSHGETYQFFYGLRLLGEAECRALREALFDSFSGMEISDIFDLLAESFAVRDKFGNTLSDYFADSVLLRSAMSIVFIEQAGEDLIIPTGALETDKFGLSVNLLQRDELKNVFDNLDRVNELISPLLDGTDADTDETVRLFVKCRDLYEKSAVLSASTIHYIVESKDFKNILDIPSRYLRAGTAEQLQRYSESSVWYAELPALAAALDEILGVSADEEFTFTEDDVSEKMFRLLKTINEASAVLTGCTKLDVCCGSDIVLSELSVKLDETVGGSVDESVLDAAKAGGMYKPSEIGALSYALNQLPLDSFDELENYDASKISGFNEPSQTHPGSTRLSVMYQSLVVAGMITHSVRDSIASGGVLVDHAGAYRTEASVYKQTEIEALISLLGGRDVEDYELGNVSEIRQYLEPDEAGNAKSCLIAATVSDRLLDKEELIVPAEFVADRLICALELSLLIDAYAELNGDGNVEDWNVGGNMKLPNISARAAVVRSTIMRATMTQTLVEQNDGFTSAAENVTLTVDAEGEDIAVLCEGQLLALFAVLDACGEEELNLPAFGSLEAVAENRNHLEVFFMCDASRYSVCAVMTEYARVLGAEISAEQAYLLAEGEKISASQKVQEVVSLETVFITLEIFV